MIHCSSSHGFSFTVNDHGAELCSLRGPDGMEYIWQADSAFWPRHSPLLFPIVGRLRSDQYSLGGRAFSMKQHGFARDMDFTAILETDGELTFRLVSSEATLRQYPFEFILDVDYRLDGASLMITYTVTNPNNSVMPFSIGAHPAFACAWEKGDIIDHYYLEFEKNETIQTALLNGGLLTQERLSVLNDSRKLGLNGCTFDRDAIILLDHKSRAITLRRRNTERRLTVKFPSFPHLGIWSKPGAPFVCIEPWFGHTDSTEPYGDFTGKPGLVNLAPCSIFTCSYEVVLHDGSR